MFLRVPGFSAVFCVFLQVLVRIFISVMVPLSICLLGTIFIRIGIFLICLCLISVFRISLLRIFIFRVSAFLISAFCVSIFPISVLRVLSFRLHDKSGLLAGHIGLGRDFRFPLRHGFIVRGPFSGAILLLHCLETGLILIPVFHQIHLILCQRRKLYLKLHGLLYIFPKAEHKHNLVAGHDAEFSHTSLRIQLCQLIEPFFIQFNVTVLLQGMNQLLCGRSLCPKNQVAQNILPGVIRRKVTELPVVILCLLKAALLDSQLRQLEQQALSYGCPFKCQQQNILGLLVLLVLLIDGCHHGQDVYIPNSAPVYGIGYLHGRFIVAAAYHLLNLLNFYVKLVFIHLLHLPIASSRYGNLLSKVPSCLPMPEEVLLRLCIPNLRQRVLRWQFWSL